VTVVARREPGYVLVTAAGEIDIAAVPALRACLWPPLAAGEPVVPGLGRVGFIDAAGLGVLAAAAGQAAAHGTRVHVACARPQTRRLLRLTGIDRAVTAGRHCGRGGRGRGRGARRAGSRRAAGEPGWTRCRCTRRDGWPPAGAYGQGSSIGVSAIRW